MRFLAKTCAILCSFIVSTTAWGQPKHPVNEWFSYDPAANEIAASMLDGANNYEPDVVGASEGLWLTWLEHVPGKGDHVWVGLRRGEKWLIRRKATDQPGRYSRPTLTINSAGHLWLSCEQWINDQRQWDVLVRRHLTDGRFAEPIRLSEYAGNDINHRVASDPTGGLWFVWQTGMEGNFEIAARRLGKDGGAGETEIVSKNSRGDWHPAVAVTPRGDVQVVWDAFDGLRFNVLARRRIGDKWKPITAVAASDAFEGRADVISDTTGRVWVAWEQGARNWGQPYRGNNKKWNNITDAYGPVHRFRLLHVAQLNADGTVQRLAEPLPMPALKRAAKIGDRRNGAPKLGVFYERGQLSIDRHGRLWVVYRHMFHPQAATTRSAKHHIESGWQVCMRCLDDDHWSPLYALDVYQRDGMQRLSIAPHGDGITAVWTSGRTDRRRDPCPRGVAMASVTRPAGQPSAARLKPPQIVALPKTRERPRKPVSATVGEKTYQLFYGDLHRHTDLSLCFAFFDGSLDDAYRYGIEAAGLDFLGVTDHTRDIARGEVLSQLWWRCVKQATRHRLGRTFHSYFAYERSHRDTDHNVISLRDDMLRNYPPPLPTFWAGLDRDTFTIPHNPVIGKIWNHHDDALRPLLEIYQGCRDQHIMTKANQGLNKGYHLGFIASSDHLSTRASYACVWAEQSDRETIFRAMQARRTFGATDKIRLVLRSGDYWMGQRMQADKMPTLQIELDGTAPIASIELWHNGKRAERVTPKEASATFRGDWTPTGELSSEHYFYIYMKQTDGNAAWSSPLWVRPIER